MSTIKNLVSIIILEFQDLYTFLSNSSENLYFSFILNTKKIKIYSY